ncbi:hypothetical protein CDL15_Pgr022105 [Punica granatum]|uniref:Uncharacterized protein n=1 Tax=Punica granatum TaxID=22663 RepID=A0A218VTE6_PUNGR|nr:hypothetical protein CDL15_Pgr022105 [Punica granatum]
METAGELTLRNPHVTRTKNSPRRCSTSPSATSSELIYKLSSRPASEKRCSWTETGSFKSFVVTEKLLKVLPKVSIACLFLLVSSWNLWENEATLYVLAICLIGFLPMKGTPILPRSIELFPKLANLSA